MPTETLDLPALAAEVTAARPELDRSQRRALACFRLLVESKLLGGRKLAERVGRPLDRIAADPVGPDHPAGRPRARGCRRLPQPPAQLLLPRGGPAHPPDLVRSGSALCARARRPTMKVQMLNGGWFTSAAGIWRRDDEMDQQVRLPVPAYLIETAAERILVDTGLDPAAIDDPAAHYDSEALAIFQLEQELPLAAQVDLGRVTNVVMTHLHFDHAGGLGQLPAGIPVYVQRREWEAAKDPASAARNFLLARDYECVADRVVLVDGDRDLLGDGSVRLLSTPGHTPGHQSVQVGERLVIGGDVSHYASGLDDHRFPVFADDHAAQAESAERLRVLRDAGADVRPGHDPEALSPGTVLA
jgi:N-acyl homoserine lactone hydrolase